MTNFHTSLCIFFVVVLLSGCATMRWATRHELPKNATEDYIEGHAEGWHAAGKAPDAFIAAMFAESAFGREYAPFFVYFSVLPVLPPKVRRRIEGESEEYQRGFTSGWLYETRLTAERLSWIDSVVFFVVRWIVRELD